MIRLSRKDDGAYLGTIEDADLQLLIDQLEEEHSQDRDYYIAAPLVDVLEEAGASETLVEVLRRAVGASDGVEIIWKEA
jgi:hypothetical protein